ELIYMSAYHQLKLVANAGRLKPTKRTIRERDHSTAGRPGRCRPRRGSAWPARWCPGNRPASASLVPLTAEVLRHRTWNLGQSGPNLFKRNRFIGLRFEMTQEGRVQ